MCQREESQGFGWLRNKNKALTLVGSLLIQFSAGLIPVWGNANIYFLSYFKNQGQQINKSTNSWILLATVLPMSIFIVFSTKLSNYFGYTKFIKICAITYFFSYLVVYLTFNLIICTIFLLIIPITVNSMSFIPMYHCLWKYFFEKKTTVTGYVLVSYGISGVLFNLLFLRLVNPQNVQAGLKDDEFVYFDQKVTDNLLPSVKIIYLIVSIFFIIGAWMIRNQEEQQVKEDEKQQQKHYELKQEAEFNSNNYQDKEIKSSQLRDMVKLKEISPSGILRNEQSERVGQFSLKQHLFSFKFCAIFSNVLLIDLYAAFLINNFKLIFIDTINDDHFLGYCLVANTITALIGTFVWGFIGDKLHIGKTMLLIIILDLVIKIFGVFSSSKPTLFIFMFFLGFTSRGMSTISGPGLIEVFGLKIATELLPIKALAVIGSLVLVPILQLIFLSFMTAFKFMNILMVVNFFLLISTWYFIKDQEKSHENQKGSEQGN